jgi:hypothetical protein
VRRPEVEEMFEGDGLSLDAVLQRCPFQALHDDEQPVLVFADVVDRTNVRMIQGRRRVLPAENAPAPGDPVPVPREGTSGHAPAKALVFRLIHDAHSATTQLSHDSVMGDCQLKHVSAMLGRGQKQVNFRT